MASDSIRGSLIFRELPLSKKSDRKTDRVRKACKSFGMSAIALFQRAYQWYHGTLVPKAARLAHTAYVRTKKAPSWVLNYISRGHKEWLDRAAVAA